MAWYHNTGGIIPGDFYTSFMIWNRVKRVE